MNILVEALRISGIWVFPIIMSIGLLFLCFVVWCVLALMKKNPNPLIVLVPLCLIPLASVLGIATGMSDIDAALEMITESEMKIVLMAKGVSIVLYLSAFLGAFVPVAMLCIGISIIPAMLQEQKDKTLPLISGGCYFLVSALSALILLKMMNPVPLIVAVSLLIMTALACISRSEQGGSRIALVATTLSGTAFITVLISVIAISEIMVFEALATTEEAVKGVIMSMGKGQVETLQMYGIPAALVAFLPAYVTAFQQQNRVLYLVMVSIVLMCFSLLLFYPNTSAVLDQFPK